MRTLFILIGIIIDGNIYGIFRSSMWSSRCFKHCYTQFTSIYRSVMLCYGHIIGEHGWFLKIMMGQHGDFMRVFVIQWWGLRRWKYNGLMVIWRGPTDKGQWSNLKKLCENEWWFNGFFLSHQMIQLIIFTISWDENMGWENGKIIWKKGRIILSNIMGDLRSPVITSLIGSEFLHVSRRSKQKA